MLLLIQTIVTLFFLSEISTSENPLRDPVFRMRMGVAECRSTCLQEPEVACTDAVCTECWQMCSRMMEEERMVEACHTAADWCTTGSGCSTACTFYQTQNSVTVRHRVSYRFRSTLEFSRPPRLTGGCRLAWGNLRFSANSLRLHGDKQQNTPVISPIYVILGRDRSGRWYEVNQTDSLATQIQPQTLAKLEEIHVFAVGWNGILTSTEVEVEHSAALTCQTDLQLTASSLSSFKVNLDGVHGDGGLAKISLSWPDFPSFHSASNKFLVNWREVPDGFITGSLYTNLSRVVLATQPDTEILVEVHLLGSSASSSQLIVNTSLQRTFDLSIVFSVISLVTSMLAILALILTRSRRVVDQHQPPVLAVVNNKTANLPLSSLPSSPTLQNTFTFPPANLKEINLVRDKLAAIKEQNINKDVY